MASSLFLPSLIPTKPAQGQVLAELGFQYLEELGSARVYDGHFRVRFFNLSLYIQEKMEVLEKIEIIVEEHEKY